MATGKEFAHSLRGGVAVACELACWSALGVSLAALMWSIVEPKGAILSPTAADATAGSKRIDALVTRLSQASDPFLDPLSATVGPVGASQEATGFTLHATRAGFAGDGTAIIAVSGGAQGAYAVGEAVANGARLTAVATDHVELDIGGQRMRLSFPGASDTTSPLLTAGLADAPADYRAVAATASPPLINSLGLQPVSRNGRPAGFEVMPQADGGLLSAAGLRPGDVLLSVNGIDASAGGDLSAYRDQLMSGRQVLIRYERAGQVRTTTVGTTQ